MLWFARVAIRRVASDLRDNVENDVPALVTHLVLEIILEGAELRISHSSVNLFTGIRLREKLDAHSLWDVSLAIIFLC